MQSNDLNYYYLQQMGIDCWVARKPNCDKELQKLASVVSSCTRCELHQTRTQTVFARGNRNAKLMIIGEAPGFHEDQQGEPFVGKAGALLDQMLASIGFTEQDVYIANVLKCRPPDNRDPAIGEIEACCDFLMQQIQLVDPQLILAVGQFAGQFLFGEPKPLNQLRSVVHQYRNKPFIVTYHPAHLLRNPKEKKHAYVDLLLTQEVLQNIS